MSNRRPPLTRERIIEAALHLVDGQGLRRLTMRRLGDALEVEAMAIYHHLPRGKEQLLDALVGHVAALPANRPVSPAGDTGPADTEPAESSAVADVSDLGPRDRLVAWSHAYRARLVAHSGVLPLLLTRRNSSALATTTASVRDLLAGGGESGSAAMATAHALLAYIIGHCAVEIRESGPAAAPSAGDSVDWDARFESGLDLVLTAVPR